MTRTTHTAPTVIYATSMIFAQGYRLTPADRAALVEQRDACRAETGVSLKAITIPVIDPTTKARIGGLRYEF